MFDSSFCYDVGNFISSQCGNWYLNAKHSFFVIDEIFVFRVCGSLNVCNLNRVKFVLVTILVFIMVN